MKAIKRLSILLILFIFFMSCCKIEQPKQYYSAKNKLFKYQGRVEVVQDSCIALISSAASASFFVEGDSLKMYAKSGNNSHNYIALSINGQYQKRYKIESSSITKILLKLPTNKQNKIEIFKATEAASGTVIFYGVYAKKLNSVPDDKKATIEFIGDSVTCGAASDTSDVPCGDGEYLDQHNAYLAYGPRIAKELNTNFILSSVSGIGIYRNWNDENIEEPIMPQVYENFHLNLDASKKYDFKIQPEIVSICLGTNDLSNGDGLKPRLPFNKQKFVSNYISFVQTVYNHYPNTKVVLINSPMLGGETNKLLVSCLKEVQTFFSENTQNSISIFQLDTVYNNGCTTHPNIEEHKQIAEKLTPLFKNILEIKN